MNVYPVEISPVNVNNIINGIQDMEDIEYFNVDKENNDDLITVASEDIPEDIKFDTWEEVDNYFDEYGIRNGFAIVKYRMERNSKGQEHNEIPRQRN
ncbi:hypothetical protein RhiirA4_467695 [Rhizophagus irregularis]|uniref:Uncharacterized protein n=1 Tax=Rhizophagus irregularis TaxID=588596 RepID=A0A2I1GWC6_9GLOM|nr:hypothetical protein RhiirA4_467695 [Rhizophagus irregularis]